MADFAIHAEGLRPVEAKLGRLLARFGDLLPLMDRLGRFLADSTRHRFETGRAPSGESWKPSLRVIAGAVPAKDGVVGPMGGKTLVQSGQLRDSITHLPSADRVEVGTNKIYAAVQQFGATIVPVNAPALSFELPGVGLVHAMQVIIPARPFVGISASDEVGLVRLTDRYAEEALA